MNSILVERGLKTHDDRLRLVRSRTTFAPGAGNFGPASRNLSK